ncbi:uncharacterized protein C1orf158 homolog [Chelonus insularis]|uniref:uncharacterized protein C1orf158 homolog n=1 Tax=Chelonus insularis TaxID=460826 RepID=UPI001589BEEB|nr:uncharacterized protein C1orf158 homolog [Chelonus insularis]
MRKNFNSILFDPGGSNVSMTYQGTKLKRKAFGYNKRCIEPGIQITEPKYNPRVLVGNWFEEQINYDPMNENIEYNNLNNDKPQKKITAGEFARIVKTKNKGLGKSLIIQPNDNKYLDNYSTTYDLMYRVLPQRLDGPRLRTYNGRINKWVPQQDITESFGNITGYGMKEYVRALQEEAIYEAYDKPRTLYQCDYVKKEIPTDIKRFHKKRVDLYKPNWYDLEVDSSMNSSWNQTFVSKHMNLCRRVACGRY